MIALSKAIARLQNRDYVVPKDVQEVFVHAVAHRVQPAPGQDEPAEALLTALLAKVHPPKLR